MPTWIKRHTMISTNTKVGRYLQEPGMFPLTMQEEGLIKANTRHTPHALTCLHMPLSPITSCLIPWEPKTLANTNHHVH